MQGLSASGDECQTLATAMRSRQVARDDSRAVFGNEKNSEKSVFRHGFSLLSPSPARAEATQGGSRRAWDLNR